MLEAIEATQSLSVASLDAQAGEDEDTPLWAMLGGEDENIEKAELRSMLGIGAKVHLVNPKSIERSEGKAKRVIDRRRL